MEIQLYHLPLDLCQDFAHPMEFRYNHQLPRDISYDFKYQLTNLKLVYKDPTDLRLNLCLS